MTSAKGSLTAVSGMRLATLALKQASPPVGSLPNHTAQSRSHNGHALVALVQMKSSKAPPSHHGSRSTLIWLPALQKKPRFSEATYSIQILWCPLQGPLLLAVSDLCGQFNALVLPMQARVCASTAKSWLAVMLLNTVSN